MSTFNHRLIMSEETESAIEILTDVSCLACLEQLGLHSSSITFLVIAGSTALRFLIDAIRIKKKRAIETNTISDK